VFAHCESHSGQRFHGERQVESCLLERVDRGVGVPQSDKRQSDLSPDIVW